MNINKHQWIHWVIHCLIYTTSSQVTNLFFFAEIWYSDVSPSWAKIEEICKNESSQPSTETFFFTHAKTRTQEPLKAYYDINTFFFWNEWLLSLIFFCNCKTFLVCSSQIFDIWNNEILHWYTLLVCTHYFL